VCSSACLLFIEILLYSMMMKQELFFDSGEKSHHWNIACMMRMRKAE